MNNVQHVFIVGAKGLGNYGGYETFLNKLTEYHQNNERIKYHIACKANGTGKMDEASLEDVTIVNDKEFVYHNARCFKVKVPEIGSAQAVVYDVYSLSECCKYIKKNNIENPIVYILACRIGPLIKHFSNKIHKLGGKIMLNPDGHEWMRAKWNAIIKKYWKLSEKVMVKNSDLVICDSKNIEKYIQEEYKKYKPNTTYISYGTETRKSLLADDDPKFINWLNEKNVSVDNYYLVVGRFVPENNYETIIREFMGSDTTRDLVLITNENKKFYDSLNKKLYFEKDKRIKFVGTVYDQELLMKIRENAYAYIHGHEVGGTNPSLLEALSSTRLNLIYKVGFNEEVCLDSTLYWTKIDKDFARIIDIADAMSEEKRTIFGTKAKMRISNAYKWQFIADRYETVFVKKN